MYRAEWLEDESKITTQKPNVSQRGIVMQNLLSVLSRADHQHAERVRESRLILTPTQKAAQWLSPKITDIRKQARRVEAARGGVSLAWLLSNMDSEGYKIADAAA
jgi:hypothetical protein